MATTNGDLRAQLREVEVTQVEETGRELGNGAYGVVKEVKVKGHRCAGKKLHELFFTESSREEQRSVTARFAQECLGHSKLHHPNIVQLIGVHFRPRNRAPTLIMELMPRSLTQALEQNPSMPSHVKNGILLDVTYGLHFLHDRTPPIIHRDLTANNILLSENMRAKIADLGQAKIVSTGPMSKTPGNPAYMPPESFTDNPVYDAKLDIFSFGALIIHTFIHDWPTPKGLFSSDPAHRGRPIALTEIERRAHHLKRMGEGNTLTNMATRCLQNDPALRPTAAEVIRELEGIIRNDPPPANTFDLLQEVSTKTERIQTLSAEKQALVSNHTAEVEGLNEQIEALEGRVESLEGDKQALEVAMSHNEAEIDEGQREITRLRENLRTKDTEIAIQRERIRTREEEVATEVEARLQSRYVTGLVSSYSAVRVTFKARNCNVLVLGKTCQGISTVCNQIIGEEYFDIKPEVCLVSVTEATSHVQRIIPGPDDIMYNVKVIDTIGLSNAKRSNSYVLENIKTYMQHHVPEGVSLALFIMRPEPPTNHTIKGFELIRKTFRGISPISALILTHCEDLSEKARQHRIQNYCTRKETSYIAEFTKKGVYTVGFPPLSMMDEKAWPRYEEEMAADVEKLRNLVFRSTDMHRTAEMFFDEDFWTKVKTESEKTNQEKCDIQ